MDRRKKALAVALLALAGAIGAGAYVYRAYRAQQSAYTEYLNAVEIEADAGNMTIKRYLDRFLLDFALIANNGADEPVTINEAVLEVLLEGKLVEKRELKSFAIASKSSIEIPVKDITLKTELLDAAIVEKLGAKPEKEKPEEAKLSLTAKIYPVYHFKLLGMQITELKTEPIVATRNISLLMLMGGKSQEESAKEFVPSLFV